MYLGSSLFPCKLTVTASTCTLHCSDSDLSVLHVICGYMATFLILDVSNSLGGFSWFRDGRAILQLVLNKLPLCQQLHVQVGTEKYLESVLYTTTACTDHVMY